MSKWNYNVKEARPDWAYWVYTDNGWHTLAHRASKAALFAGTWYSSNTGIKLASEVVAFHEIENPPEYVKPAPPANLWIMLKYDGDWLFKDRCNIDKEFVASAGSSLGRVMHKANPYLCYGSTMIVSNLDDMLPQGWDAFVRGKLEENDDDSGTDS